MQPAYGMKTDDAQSPFQSSFIPWAECNHHSISKVAVYKRFNPHSSLGLNATVWRAVPDRM